MPTTIEVEDVLSDDSDEVIAPAPALSNRRSDGLEGARVRDVVLGPMKEHNLETEKIK